MYSDCPLREDFNNLARRVAVLDGNGIDPTGGVVGRVAKIAEGHQRIIGRAQILGWIAIGALSVVGLTNVMLYKTLERLMALLK